MFISADDPYPDASTIVPISALLFKRGPVAASWSFTRDTCVLHTVTTHCEQDRTRPDVPTGPFGGPSGARGGDSHEARHIWAPRNRHSARRHRRRFRDGMRAGAVPSRRPRTLRP